MDRVAYSVFGFGANDDLLVSLAVGGLPTGWTLEETTTADGVRPPGGAPLRWLKATTSAVVAIIVAAAKKVDEDLKTIIWDLGTHRFEGTIGVGDLDRFVRLPVDGGDGDVDLWWVGSDTDKWKLRATKTNGFTLIANGANEYNNSASNKIRCQMSGTRIKIWVNGVLEIDVAYTGTREDQDFPAPWQPRPPTTSGVAHYWAQWATAGSDSESDLPDNVVTVVLYQPIADGPDTEYSGTTAVVADVQLDGNLDVITGSEWSGNPGLTEKQNAEFVDGISSVDLAGIGVRTTSKLGAAKLGDFGIVILDDIPNQSSVTPDSAQAAGFAARSAFFRLAPDGSTAWPDFDMDDFLAGVEHTDANLASDDHAALVIELLYLTTDPDAPAGVDAKPPASGINATGLVIKSPKIDPLLILRPEGGPLRTMRLMSRQARKRLRGG